MNDKQVLFHGKLQRFKPSFGTHAIFIDRYLQLTRSLLNYFKAEPILRKLVADPHVEVNQERPLFRIPLG